MALLWSQLPAESRVARMQAPELAWGAGDYLLWHIEADLRGLAWALQYDKKHPQPKPRPLPTPGGMADARAKAASALDSRDELDRLLEGVL